MSDVASKHRLFRLETMSLDSEIRLLRLVFQKPMNHYNNWGAARGDRVGRARSDAK